MKNLSKQADVMVKSMQAIADALGEYNPELCKEKTPLSAIQYDLACLGRDLTWLYTEIGKKIKNDTILNRDL